MMNSQKKKVYYLKNRITYKTGFNGCKLIPENPNTEQLSIIKYFREKILKKIFLKIKNFLQTKKFSTDKNYHFLGDFIYKKHPKIKNFVGRKFF